MVQGMAFLSKKGFNPHNNVNRKQVWEAQQKSKNEKERLRKRQQQLQREQEDAELELATKGEIGGSQAQLRFMYDAPPGMETSKNNSDERTDSYGDSKSEVVDDLTHVKPGDDAAAVAFRQMLAAAATSAKVETEESSGMEKEGVQSSSESASYRFSTSLQGTTVEADARYNNNNSEDNPAGDGKPKKSFGDSRSALEKEVGRKNRSSQNNLSYEQQIERFPQLKNAPMAVKRSGTTGGEEGAAAAPMMVHFKPLGSQILHVRCLACGIWGHARGDRECRKSGWNPFALPSAAATSNPPADAATTSSILPSKGNNQEQSSGRKESEDRKRRHRGRYDSDTDDSRHRHRRHRRRHDDDSDSDSYDSQRRRDRKDHRRRRRRRYESDDSNEPSSEDSSKLKRRNDEKYYSSEDDHERKRNKKRRHRDRDRKSSKKSKRSKRHESSRKKSRRDRSP